MTSMFGPHGQRVLALITCIQGLPADQVDQVTSAWKCSSPGGRARAWAQLNQSVAEEERYRILAAASWPAARRWRPPAGRSGRTGRSGPPPATRPRPPRPATGSAATTTPSSPRSHRSCPHWPAARPRHPAAPPTTKPSRTRMAPFTTEQRILACLGSQSTRSTVRRTPARPQRPAAAAAAACARSLYSLGPGSLGPAGPSPMTSGSSLTFRRPWPHGRPDQGARG